MKTHHLFISHSWSYSGQYDRLIDLRWSAESVVDAIRELV